MNFSKSLQELNTKAFSEKGSEYLYFDMLYQISYMSAIASAGIPRSKVIDLACNLPCFTTKYFKQIKTLADKLRLDYAVACRTVGETAKEQEIRGFLLRWSASMSAGESEADFLAQEAQIAADAYNNSYSRDVDTLRMWTEAYAAIIISAALMVMVAAISMLIYPVAMTLTLGVVGLTIASAIMGAWIISKVSPKEIRYHFDTPYCEPLNRARRIERVMVPAAVVCAIVMLILGAGMGFALIVGALLLLPTGIAGYLIDRQIARKDRDLPSFIRSTGNIASAVGITTSQALDKLDLRAVEYLKEDINNLRSRIAARLKPENCWRRFALETGSETVFRSIKMFDDATRMGGEPDEVGARACLLPTSIAFLRAKRTQVSLSFGALALGMHIAVVCLLLFVVEVIMAFGEAAAGTYYNALEGVQSEAVSVFSLNFGAIGMLDMIATPILLVLSTTVAFAAKSAMSGSRYTFLIFLAVTTSTSGLGMIVIPRIADMLFAPVTAF